jgi:hypothetical protein
MRMLFLRRLVAQQRLPLQVGDSRPDKASVRPYHGVGVVCSRTQSAGDVLFRSEAKLLRLMQRDTAELGQHVRVVFKMGADKSSSSRSSCSRR